MTPPLYETPAPPSSSIQVTFAFFVGISENRIARLPRYPDSPNMAFGTSRSTASHPPLRISRLSPSVTEFLISGILRGSTPTQDWWEYWDTERSEQSVSSPFNVFSAFARASLHLGRDSSGALLKWPGGGEAARKSCGAAGKSDSRRPSRWAGG